MWDEMSNSVFWGVKCHLFLIGLSLSVGVGMFLRLSFIYSGLTCIELSLWTLVLIGEGGFVINLERRIDGEAGGDPIYDIILLYLGVIEPWIENDLCLLSLKDDYFGEVGLG